MKLNYNKNYKAYTSEDLEILSSLNSWKVLKAEYPELFLKWKKDRIENSQRLMAQLWGVSF